MLTALLFDLDGTIADTDPIHYQTWQEVMLGYGLAIDSSFYKAHFSGRLNEQIIQELLPQLSIAAGQQLSSDKEATFRQRAAHLQLLPGLIDLLNWADQQGLPYAAVTNAPRKNAEFMLQTLGVQDRFSIVILAEELERGKPDPLPYQVALEHLKVTAEQAIAFEDSPTGITSAVGAGLSTVGMATTHSSEKLYELGATLVVSDFTDDRLQHLLQNLLTSTDYRNQGIVT
jgi:HAD superfamily hydrolase (TIGR01509 family)